MVWVSIEHAPKDGTPVDLWVMPKGRGSGKRIPHCYWSFARNKKGEALVDQAFDGWCCDIGKPPPNSWNPYPNLIAGTPTHYMDITEILKGPR